MIQIFHWLTEYRIYWSSTHELRLFISNLPFYRTGIMKEWCIQKEYEGNIVSCFERTDKLFFTIVIYLISQFFDWVLSIFILFLIGNVQRNVRKNA